MDVEIPAGSLKLPGMLEIPEGAKGLVVFAHGSGSSRFSKRNNFVAQVLRDYGMGTLLFDLLTEEEDRIYENRFDIPLISKRLVLATQWAMKEHPDLKIGLFGSSTGSAAALIAASALGDKISAVVSRGGRPDLAMSILPEVKASTLLIVGGADYGVIELNQKAYEALASEKVISIVPGATHLFEEPGALEEVARLAAEWFKKHFLLEA
jgi:pimeloyl-ACP methyl ester carboxylesterase